MNAYRAEQDVQLPEIIERPDLQSRIQRSLFAAIAAAGWLIWLYLFAPLLSLLGWVFGIQRFQVYVLFNEAHSLSTLLVYGLIIVVAGLALIGWALYNYFRFRGEDRRAAPSPVNDAQLADGFRIDVQQVQAVQQARISLVSHDEHGHISGVHPVDAAPRDTV